MHVGACSQVCAGRRQKITLELSRVIVGGLLKGAKMVTWQIHAHEAKLSVVQRDLLLYALGVAFMESSGIAPQDAPLLKEYSNSCATLHKELYRVFFPPRFASSSVVC